MKEVAPGYYEQNSEKDPWRRPRTNSWIDGFLLVMCRSRQGLAELHLAHLFGMSQSSVRRTVISWVNFM